MDRTQLETKFVDFAKIATAWHPKENLVDEMLPSFRTELQKDADNIWHLIEAATRTFHRHHVGIWLDHSEGYLAYENSAAVISNSVVNSASYKNWERQHTDIVWPGAPSHESVAEGLLGFKGWLHENSGLTLVHVNTGGDFFFSVVVDQHAETALIEWITNEGGSLEVVKPPRKLRVKNIVHAYLTERHGFTRMKQGRDRQYTHWEKKTDDPKYTAAVHLREYDGRCQLDLGVYNADLQETFEQTRLRKWSDVPHMFRQIAPEFFGGKPMFRYMGPDYFDTDAALIAETHEVLDGCIANFLEVADSQEQLIEYIETKSMPMPMPRIVLALVRGWSEAAEEEFLRPKEERLAELEAQDPDTRDAKYDDAVEYLSGFLASHRKWIAANPHGLPGW